MKIVINDTEFDVALNTNDTVTDIATHLPMDLEMTRYAGHEYYATLPFTPRDNTPHTSALRPGYIYYWGGGNAFVINFADSDISPYGSVEIGHITNDAATQMLQTGAGKISVRVTK